MDYNDASQWTADLGSGYSRIYPLGEGGMGTLYCAHKDSLDVDVVIKRVKQKFKGRMDERAEANILKTLKHKYLPRIYDVIESQSGYVYTIMDPKKRKMAYLELTIDYRETAGCFSKRRWLLEPNCTIKIGRSATSDVMMPANNRISRNHCEIFYNEKRKDFTIRDLSKFGSFLSSGEPMEKGKQYTLRDGDSFYVLSPEYTFKVVIEA